MALVESSLTSGIHMFHSINEKCHVNRVSTRPWNKESRWSKYPTIVGSCNGLLLMGAHDDLFLWNPVTKYFKKVLSYAPLGDDGFRIASGLCYDSSAKEYKAVMVFFHENQDSKGRFAVVGSFKSKSWRRVRCPDGVFHEMMSGPVVNKHLHWQSNESDHYGSIFSSRTIMYFDIQMNEFHEVPMPKPPPPYVRFGVSFRFGMGLGVLDECLCMIRKNSITDDVEVLAMKEYGIRESWTTMFIIPNLTLGVARNLELFGYTKRGEVLMKVPVGDMGCEMTTYNPMDSSRRKISIQDDCDYVNAVMYEETMVTPTDYDWEDKELRGEATYVEYFLHRPPQKMRKRRDGIWQVCPMEKEDNKPTTMTIENREKKDSYKRALLNNETMNSFRTILTSSPGGVSSHGQKC